MPKSAYTIALVAALAAVAAWGSSSSAHAQSSRTFVDPYLAAKVTLGLGGSVDASAKTNSGEISQTQDLTVSFGVGAQYLYPLHEYFSLGGLLDFQSWRSTSDGGGGRNLVFDLAVLPQGKYVLLPGRLELNFGIPIGIALDFWNEVDVTNTWVRFASGAAAGGKVSGNNAVGFVIGALIGARYQLIEDLGLLLELGYMYRTVGHSITTSANAGNLVATASSNDITVSWGQLTLNLGVYF
jgi:hypothetical protein